jgi:RHS repeat-associated protein
MKSLSYSIIFCLLLAGLSSLVTAQTDTMNYIQSFDVQVKGITDPASLLSGTPTSTALQTIQYSDGLGRPVQTVQKGITTEGYDMVKPITYNNVGLDETNYEPYVVTTASTGNFQAGFASDQPAFYSARFTYNNGTGEANGKSPTVYEKSPLNRVLKQGAPGADWQLIHPVQFDYLTNNNSDLKAVLWMVSGNTCNRTEQYTAGQLYVTKTTGEDQAITYEFIDKQGQVVLKRSVLDATTNADTYYVYDDFGLLRFVISPEGSKQITASFDTTNILAKRYVYAYNYDGRKRMIAKRIPGKEPEYYVYDKTDKVILYQDGNMRKYKPDGITKIFEWMFTKYDAMGRVIMTGITKKYKSHTRDAMQALAYGISNKCWEFISYSGTALPNPNDGNYYSNLAFPVLTILNDSTNFLLTVNYYDRYNVYLSGSNTPVPIANNYGIPFTLAQTSNALYQPELQYVTGKPTVNFVRYNNFMLQSATYYDVYGRVIQTCAENQSGVYGFDRFTNLYQGLTSNILRNEHRNFVYGGSYLTLNEVTDYNYDAAGRPVTNTYNYNGTGTTGIPRVINYYYTTLGQVKSKQIKDNFTVMQNVDYTYNIRGWLSSINNPATLGSDLFGMELFYNKTDAGLNNSALFNGNISAIKWQTAQPAGISTPSTIGQKAFKYSYDKLNRILIGDYSEMVNSAWDNTTKKYSESITNYTTGKSYDLNGNIQGIIRNGLQYPNNATGVIDKLKYSYDGNKLVAVDDAWNSDNGGDFIDRGQYFDGTPADWEYTYDKNGNLTKDLNKGILSITYNYLNLPTSITKSGDTRIEYSYDATGTKREQRYYVNNTLTKTTSFYTNFVYENYVPAWVTYDEGRVVLNSNGTANINEAYLKDHLGNIRVAYYMQAGILKTQQVNSYYPFGMNIKGLSANGSATYKPNKYLYNGKMMQDEMGLGWLDYGARFYDAVLGRWMTIDPKAELGRRWSPYNYGFDNPLKFIDPDGQWPGFIHNIMINKAFKPSIATNEITKEQIQYIKDGSKNADTKPGNQDVDQSFIHGMGIPGESSEVTTQKENNYVGEKFKAFENTKDVKESYTAFGEGAHTAMDNTSPTHTDKQKDGSYTSQTNNLGELKALSPKTWVNAPKWILHTLGELIPSKGRMNDAVQALRSEYRQEVEKKDQNNTNRQ